MHRITMLGTGLIGMFYTRTLHSGRGQDRVHVLYSRAAERAGMYRQNFQQKMRELGISVDDLGLKAQDE